MLDEKLCSMRHVIAAMVEAIAYTVGRTQMVSHIIRSSAESVSSWMKSLLNPSGGFWSAIMMTRVDLTSCAFKLNHWVSGDYLPRDVANSNLRSYS